MELWHDVIYDAAVAKDNKHRLNLDGGVAALGRFVEVANIDFQGRASVVNVVETNYSFGAFDDNVSLTNSKKLSTSGSTYWYSRNRDVRREPVPTMSKM